MKDPMQPNLYTVDQIRSETQDTFTLALLPKQPGHFTFLPGQFNMLYMFGVGEVPISISGSTDFEAVIHTVRAVGAVTGNMALLTEGSTIGLRGPYGSSWPVKKAEGKDVVFVAGGIGLAPLRPAIYHCLQNRDLYQKIVILYGARTPDDLLYEDELHEWRSRFDLEVELTVDSASKKWHGHVGVVTRLLNRAEFDPQQTVSMICGPEIMMRFTIQKLSASGVSIDNIFLSMERNMKCAIGLCGHCQYGPMFICKDGPVFSYSVLQDWWIKREI